MWLMNLIVSCKTLSTSGNICQYANFSLWMTQCIVSHSKVTSWIRVLSTENRPVSAAAPGVHTSTKMTDWIFLKFICLTTWIVLLGWCYLAKTVHKFSFSSSWKINPTKLSNFALLLSSVDSSTGRTYHGDALISSYNCVSTSSAISSICLLFLLLTVKGKFANF